MHSSRKYPNVFHRRDGNFLGRKGGGGGVEGSLRPKHLKKCIIKLH